MTEEERREAERTAIQIVSEHWTESHRDGDMIGTGEIRRMCVKAFAAACESKRAEIAALRELLVEWDDDLGEAVKAERSHASKLLAALKHVRGYIIACGSQGTAGVVDEAVIYSISDTAIAEYEAEK